MIVISVQKLQECCPLKYQITHWASSLSPCNMVSDSYAQSKHNALISFDEKKSLLVSFFVDLMHRDARYRKCWTIFKIVFALAHGQVDVDSVNKELLVENLQQNFLIVKGSFLITSPIFQSPSLKFC